jgi:molybdopterin-binding protein
MMFKPNYLLTTAILSAAFCGLSTTDAWAQSNGARHGFSTSQQVESEEVQAPKPVQASNTPATPEIVGLVKSYQGNSLQVRLSDGTNQTYQIDPTVTGSSEIRQGSFVSLDMDEQGKVKTLEMAEVDKVYDGTINNITDDQVTLDLEDGSTYTATISPATVTRMGLESGSPLKVTTYKGTTATRVCLGQKATPIAAPPPVSEPPEPVGGGELEPTPALPPQPRALW